MKEIYLLPKNPFIVWKITSCLEMSIIERIFMSLKGCVKSLRLEK